jgi:ATP phosphoribosyltransferase
MIKIALPNKGVLFEPTLEMLQSSGYKINKSLKTLSSVDTEHDVEFYFLRPGDIPLYVTNGILDAGITGKDFVAEQGLKPLLLLDLNYGKSRLCAAVKEDSSIRELKQLKGKKIATSFPNLTKKYFTPDPVEIVNLEGAVEISIKLGIAEAVADLVETGTTLRQAGLRIVGEPLFQSNAALFANPAHKMNEQLLTLKNRLEGRMVAYEFMMVEYDTPESLLKQACAITPGIESPTIMSLQKKDWYSVKSMIRKSEAHRIMDNLARLGCKGILLTSIESARI